jgi:hypothetical protein
MLMEAHHAVLVGYFPKITHPGLEWLGNQSVLEICSVSNCISVSPEDWISHWKHNEFGFYDSEEIAQAVIGESEKRFDLYAYKLYPFRCLQGKTELIPVIGEDLNPLAEDYVFLGFDIVTKSSSDFFECSPLSCNAGASEYPVNRFCLISTKELARQALSSICTKGTYEPGPYFLFEVYRRHISQSSFGAHRK